MSDFGDPRKDFVWIGLDNGKATIRSYSAASKGAATIVKIEVEVRDPVSLSALLRDLAEARQPPKPATPRARQLAIPDLRGKP